MTLLEAIILGIIQGATEFLPVSSSGHLTIAQHLFGLSDPEANLSFIVFLHFTSVLAVIVAFFSEIRELFGRNFQVLIMVVIGSIPAALVGLLLHNQIEGLFGGNLTLVGVALILTGIFLCFGELGWGRSVSPLENASFISVFWVGIAQAVAIIPGLSRSGLTISTGLLTGLDKKSSVRFSFFLSVPIILGASFVKLKDFGKIMEGFQPIAILAGGFACFVVSLLAIKLLVKMVQRGQLYIFGLYCLAAGLIVLILRLFGI